MPPPPSPPPLPLVSVVMTCRDNAEFLEAALRSVAAQDHRPLELSFWDDGSVDASSALARRLAPELEAAGVRVVLGRGEEGRGIGFGKNRAVEQSAGVFLCHLDADDVAFPDRVRLQLARAMQEPAHRDEVLVGAGFVREPASATPRYTAWANGLTDAQLVLQQLKECTLVHPTWFCSRAVHDCVGGYDEGGPGTPEDLIFFYRHLALGGRLARAPQPLLLWRFHAGSTTGGRAVSWRTIWDLRIARLVALLEAGRAPLAGGFTIWNAGREGKRVLNSLPPALKARVAGFCDVDAKKWVSLLPRCLRGEGGQRPRVPGLTGAVPSRPPARADPRLARKVHRCAESRREIPIVHFTEARPPLLICVKQGLTGGEFEANLASLGLTEGAGYLYFSF